MDQSGIDELTKEEGEEYIWLARDSVEYQNLQDTFHTRPETRGSVYRVRNGEIVRYVCIFDIQDTEEDTIANIIVVIERNDVVHAEVCLDYLEENQIVQSNFITAEGDQLESHSVKIIANSEESESPTDDEDDVGSSSSPTISSVVSHCTLCKALVFAAQQTTQITTGALCAMAASALGPASIVAGTLCHQIAGKVIAHLSKGGTTKSPKSVCKTLGYCP